MDITPASSEPEIEPVYSARALAKDMDRTTRLIVKDLHKRIEDYVASGSNFRVTIHIHDFRATIQLHTHPRGEK